MTIIQSERIHLTIIHKVIIYLYSLRTGSAPNSPEFSRKTSSFTTPSSGSNVSTATNTPMSTNTPESQHSHSSHVINHNNNNEDVANGLMKGRKHFVWYVRCKDLYNIYFEFTMLSEVFPMACDNKSW